MRTPDGAGRIYASPTQKQNRRAAIPETGGSPAKAGGSRIAGRSRKGKSPTQTKPARARLAALLLGPALAIFQAGEAAAQNLCAGDLVTERATIVVCDRAGSETRDVHIRLRDPAISLTGHNESPVTADTYGVGSVTIEVTGGSLSSSGNWAKGIRSWSNGGSGDVAVTVKDVDITTANDNGNAVYVRRQAGTGNIRIDASGGVFTTTGGGVSQGITGWVQVAGNIDIDTKDVVMRTEGANSLGIFGYQQGPTGDVDVAVQGGSIETNGFLAHGVYSGKIGGTGNADLSVSGGASVTTRGRFTRAVNGVSSGEGGVTVDVSGEAVIVAEGEGSVGVYLLHVGNGSVHATIGAETRIAAPFANGVYGRLMPSANAAERIVIDARGRIEARNAGILAWAEPRSGSTFGEGGEAADETAGTAPMIHVTSGGDVTVGEGVMDAYIRAAVAGDDGALSAGEQAVLDAIAAGDEDALTTALAALPDDYDDAWKARMRAFRAARGAMRTDHHGSRGNAPGANARLAEAAAVEILDIPRAGIRAMALSHTEIADYVRRGGLGGTLSDDERTVLAAVLTGGDLEAALAALPAAYTDNWKDGVRLRAMSYNAGDVRVDVTGGKIAADGDGVHARYVVAHDRNGAIAVSVAEGASVTGERHGVYAGGAGLDDDGLRAHTVTVNGAVMGGTGAGVRLVGGGRLTVGATGSVGATSGDAVLSDGGGDLSVMVAGTVEGDIRTLDDGDLTVSVMEGGVVAGTIHDPVVPMTIAGSVGRLLLTNGGEVSLTSTGALTGVDGEVLRNAAGDLSVSVAGRVEGDLRNAGGDLTLTSAAGSVITGTVHDPATPLRVAGSVGRLLLTNGGEVTVASTGALTGVDGEAIRSEAGDLSVVVAGMASGRIRGVGGGLRATISGRVDGDVEGLGDGEHTVTVSTGGVVTGKIHVAASTVTVDGTVGEVRFDAGGTLSVGPNGRILSREGVAARNEGGDLVVTIRAAPGERPERAIARVGGRIEGAADGETTVTLVPADGEAVRLGEAGTRASVPSGAYDVGVSTSEGAVAFTSAIAPRAKVYEALPSVLLGMSAPLAHGERRGAPRAAGGGWARIEGARGDWRAGGSTAGAAYDVTRHGVRAGFDVSVDANLLLGFSVHHVRGSADVAGGGEIEVRGSGAGVSAAYAFGGGFYLEGQVETTFYAVDLESDLRGGLKTGASASGLAMGAELGKRMRFRRGTLTPRARLVRSSVSLDRFTDELGGRVSIRDADSLKGSLGLLAEAVRTSGEEEFALRGSVDVESVLSGEETVIEVGGDRLHAEAEKTRVLVGLGARWRKGDLSVGGEISAHGPGSDHESLGGRLSLGWRF